MSIETIIRAWKDSNFRNTLTTEELASLPANPAGSVELNREQLAGMQGGARPTTGNSCYSYRTQIQGCVCP